MASPQIENGFTRLANELLEALSRTNFSCYQRRVLDAILRKTYGYGKKADRIPLSQIVLLTGIQKGHVSRSMNELIERNVVTSRGTPRKLGINKNYHEWRDSGFRHDSKKGYLTGNGVTPRGNFRVPDGEPQKKYKERNKRGLPDGEPNQLPDWLDLTLWGEFRKHRKAIKATMTDLAEKKLLIRLEKLMQDTGSSQQDIIEQSIMNGWKGLFEVKDHGKRKENIW